MVLCQVCSNEGPRVQDGPAPWGPRFKSLKCIQMVGYKMRVLGLNHRNRWEIFLSLLLQNHLPQMFEIWFVALPGGLLCAM